jgi:hypothetical protein
MLPIVLVIVAIIIVILVVKNKSGTGGGTSYSITGTPVSEVLSHWSNAFPFFSMPSDAFYRKIEDALRDHDMPNVKIGRVTNKEGGLFSASREYLRIMYRDLVFELCASPYGKDFFVSWWLYATEGTLRQFLKYTKVGEYLRNRAAKKTFFQADQEAMFRACVHNVVLEVVNKITEVQGQRGLTDTQKAIIEGGM